ncbi:MAG: T9SS type A sorting domain-containing protein [bacterium]
MTKSLVLNLIVGLCALTMTAQAQIPNPGFENWDDAYTPVGWYTNNVQVLSWITITRTGIGESHSGSYAMRGEVILVMDIPYPPLAFTGSFPVSQRCAELRGWYRFSPINGDILIVAIALYGEGVGGGGSIDIAQPASQFTRFSVPISYSGTGVPDTAMIVVEILRHDTADVSVGSFFILDDLSLEGVASVPREPANQIIPADFSLHQNYPNPFNAATTIRYDLKQTGPVELIVFDLLGKEVAKLASGPHLAGSYTATWNAAGLPSGIYLCRMQAQGFTQTRKVMFVK